MAIKKDFDVSELVKIDQHEKDRVALEKRILQLENKVGTSEKIADTIFEASQKAVKLRTMIGNLLIELIQKDTKIRNELLAFIAKSDRNEMKLFWKKFGLMLWSAIIFILGIVATIIIQKYVK